MSPLAMTSSLAVAYDVSGAGPPLVLFHAGVTDRRLWDAMVPSLEAHFTVYRPDLRGFGETTVTRPGDWYLYRDVIEFLDAVGVERAHLGGVSQGGAAALNAALESPGRVDRLILINPALYGFDHWTAAELAAWEQVDRAMEAGDHDTAADLEVAMWLAGPSRSPATMDPAIVDRMKAMLIASFGNEEGGEEQADEPYPAERLGEISVPTLVVSGSLDLPGMVAIAEKLATEIPDATLVRLPNTAHLVPFEFPAELAAAMLEFLT